MYMFLLVYWNILLNFCLNIVTVGWASWQNVQGFGEPPTAKSQILNLIRSIRTVARSNYKQNILIRLIINLNLTQICYLLQFH